jgi:hypothetical protein
MTTVLSHAHTVHNVDFFSSGEQDLLQILGDIAVLANVNFHTGSPAE